MNSDDDDNPLVERLRGGDDQVLGELFERHRPRLCRIISFRLDPALGGRIDVDDVMQESFLAAAKRLKHFREKTDMSFGVWIRLIAIQTLADIVRRHFAAQKRDVHAEVSIEEAVRRVDETAASFAGFLMSRATSPSARVQKIDLAAEIEAALEELSTTDREVLALRHFEELTNNEVAEILGIHKAAATNRYLRALKRLETVLARHPHIADLIDRR